MAAYLQKSNGFLRFWTFTGRQNRGGGRAILKSEWEVEGASPGVADHITLMIAARAGLVAVHVAAQASAGASRFGGCARRGLFSRDGQNP